MCPDPEDLYQCELEYPRELCDLTLRAMRRETGLADFFGGDEADDGKSEDAVDEAGDEMDTVARSRRKIASVLV